MKCQICHEEFDPANLTSVMIHEHREDLNPAEGIGIRGHEKFPLESPQFWAGYNSEKMGHKLSEPETNDFKRGYWQSYYEQPKTSQS